MNLFKRWFKKPEPKLTTIGNAILKLSSIDANSMKSVYSSDMSIRRVHVLFNTILEYNTFIENVIHNLRNNILISTSIIPRDVKYIYIRDFYLDSKGRYLEPVSATDNLIRLSIALLTVYEELEKADNDFTIERNLYLLNGVISNIIVLSEEL